MAGGVVTQIGGAFNNPRWGLLTAFCTYCFLRAARRRAARTVVRGARRAARGVVVTSMVSMATMLIMLSSVQYVLMAQEQLLDVN